jgi:Zn-dependent protease with chaperone function
MANQGDRKPARPRVALTDISSRAWEHPADRGALVAMRKLKGFDVLLKTMSGVFRERAWRLTLLGSAVRVDERQFSRLHRLLAEVGRSLDAVRLPEMYVAADPTLSAQTVGMDRPVIVLSSGMVHHLDDDELRFVIGHECGHIHNSHVVYLTAMYYLRYVAGALLRWAVAPAAIALSAWSRRAEITCDRAGLLCAKDLEVSTRALAKLALGSTKLYSELNLDAFLDQYEEAKDGVGRYAEINHSHPYLPKRVMALRAFAESSLYRKHVGLGDGGLSMPEVDDKVHGIIKVIG